MKKDPSVWGGGGKGRAFDSHEVHCKQNEPEVPGVSLHMLKLSCWTVRHDNLMEGM